MKVSGPPAPSASTSGPRSPARNAARTPRRGGPRPGAAPTTNGDALLPDAHNDRLVHSTFALLISNGTGVVLGVGFWAAAARLYRIQDVGRGAQEIQAMTLLAAFALLNMGTVFPRFLYAAGARAGLVLRSGYAACTSIALVGSATFILFWHHTYIEAGLLPSVVFVASVVLWVIFTIEDAALVGLRSTFWVPVENTSFSVAKIALLPVFAVVAHGVGVYTSWVLPLIGCVAAINLYLWRRVLPAHVQRSSGAGVLPHRRVIKNVVLGEYLGGLSFTAMATVPVLMVGALLSTKAAAYLQTPWLAGTSFDALLFSFATSLIVEATARPNAAAASVKRSVRLALYVLGPSVLVLIVGAPWFLRLLGPSYAQHGTRLLQFLVLALPFMAVNVLYVTYARLARRVRRVFLVQVSIAAFVLTLCYVLVQTRLGITGAGVAYLGGQGLMALILLPSVVRQYRHPEMAPDYAPGASLVARSAGSSPPTTPGPPPTVPAPSADGAATNSSAGAPVGAPPATPVAPAPRAAPIAVRDTPGPRTVPDVWRRRPSPPATSSDPADGDAGA